MEVALSEILNFKGKSEVRLVAIYIKIHADKTNLNIINRLARIYGREICGELNERGRIFL
jgi:hypothetical protein